jgi:hypothetical protein
MVKELLLSKIGSLFLLTMSEGDMMLVGDDRWL